MENENTNVNTSPEVSEKITWSPEAKIEITGREFEVYAQLANLLYEVPLSSLSPKETQALFVPALQANQDILKRMLDAQIAEKNTGGDKNTDAIGPTPLPVE
jgi:hypothetical protein